MSPSVLSWSLVLFYFYLTVTFQEEEEENEPKKKTTNWLIPIEDDFTADDNDEILSGYFQNYQGEVASTRDAYHNLYRNWEKTSAKVNRWKLWTDQYHLMSEATFKLQRYMTSIKNNKVAQLDGICITPK